MIESDRIPEQVRMCAACPKMCRHVCPTFFVWRSDSPTPHGRALLIHYDGTGTQKLDPRGIEVLYQCLECSHCLTWCLPEIDIASIVEATRRRIVESGTQPEELLRMATSVRTNHNPFEESHSERNSWINTKTTSGESVIYFAGCTASYREQSIAESTLSVLTSGLGYNVLVSDDEWCCGSPLFRTGHYDIGLESARHNVDLLNSMNAECIIVSCPGCLRVLTQDYPENGLELNKPVFHISQVLEDRLEVLSGRTINGTATFHDPCHLGRHCSIYDPPRNIIKHLLDGGLVEMEHNRDDAMCCGNGAGLRTLFPDKAKEIGTERVEQAIRTEADFLITACPFCKNLLEAQSMGRIEVLDLPELVKMAGQHEGEE